MPQDRRLNHGKQTCSTTCSQLAAFLRESYRDSRGERPTSASGLFTIRIDDRRSTEVSPDFCSLTVVVPRTSAPNFTLHLSNPPLDAETRALIADKDGTITGSRAELQEIPADGGCRLPGGPHCRAGRPLEPQLEMGMSANRRFNDRLADTDGCRRLRRHTPDVCTILRRQELNSAGLRPAEHHCCDHPPAQVDDEDIFRLLGRGECYLPPGRIYAHRIPLIMPASTEPRRPV